MPCCKNPTVFKCCGVAVPTIFTRLDPCEAFTCFACLIGAGKDGGKDDKCCNMCTGECKGCGGTGGTRKCYPCVTVEWASDEKAVAVAPAPQSMAR